MPETRLKLTCPIRTKDEIKISNDVSPFVPEHWTLHEHTPCGDIPLNLGAVFMCKTLNPDGECPLDDLSCKLMDARLLDWLLENPWAVPSPWLQGRVIFPGTVYKDQGGRRCIRMLVEKEHLTAGWEPLWISGNSPKEVAAQHLTVVMSELLLINS